ncbi:MAG: hypothetical protein KDI88_14700 [Gammaproteobacteria bacterium]|nr:hypothetical protein [Gammaproteobacteria bacterium]
MTQRTHFQHFHYFVLPLWLMPLSALAVQQNFQRIAPDTAMTNTWFGRVVAINGNTAVIGRGLPCSATVYRLVETDGRWKEPVDLAPADDITDHDYGAAVATAGDIAMVGTPGNPTGVSRVRVFERDNCEVWHKQEAIVSPSGLFGAGAYFGSDIAMDGERAVISGRGGAASNTGDRETDPTRTDTNKNSVSDADELDFRSDLLVITGVVISILNALMLFT